jgi:hypothetical protein
MYDSKIGRWTSIDPKKQYASPYVGMGNRWADGVDPDGGLFGKFFSWISATWHTSQGFEGVDRWKDDDGNWKVTWKTDYNDGGIGVKNAVRDFGQEGFRDVTLDHEGAVSVGAQGGLDLNKVVEGNINLGSLQLFKSNFSTSSSEPIKYNVDWAGRRRSDGFRHLTFLTKGALGGGGFSAEVAGEHDFWSNGSKTSGTAELTAPLIPLLINGYQEFQLRDGGGLMDGPHIVPGNHGLKFGLEFGVILSFKSEMKVHGPGVDKLLKAFTGF